MYNLTTTGLFFLGCCGGRTIGVEICSWGCPCLAKYVVERPWDLTRLTQGFTTERARHVLVSITDMLLLCLLFPAGVQCLHRILLARDQGQGIRDFHRYVRFVRDVQTIESKSRIDGQCTLWPGWKHNIGTLTSTPSVAVLMTIEKFGHDQVRTTSRLEGVGVSSVWVFGVLLF